MVKKFVCVLLAVIICFSVMGCAKNAENYIYDGSGEIVVASGDIASLSDENSAYVDVVVAEACDIIAKIKGSNAESVKKQLKNYSIYTYLDKSLTPVIADAYANTVMGTNFGCAITDLDGKLLSVFSASSTKDKNFAREKMQQHSTIKPLSVYAPAIESGTINWSTLTEDSPYKQLVNSKGVTYDWPSNATGKYTYENVSVYTAIKQSVNTVAVKILSQYGVNNSIDFLQNKLGIDLKFEQYKATIYGEDEVIGNIALGATQAGSTPIDMAGYYQIFANGGYYTAPTAIKKITDSKGNIVYEDTSQSAQVISAETSYIMNELLRGVTKASGTGADAYVEGVQISGKTGTGDASADNWFVGVTPEFSCAVYHSNFNNTNLAATVFSDIVENTEIENTLFMTSPNVEKYIYCAQSGMLLGSGCKKAEMGYFLKDNPPQSCTFH